MNFNLGNKVLSAITMILDIKKMTILFTRDSNTSDATRNTLWLFSEPPATPAVRADAAKLAFSMQHPNKCKISSRPKKKMIGKSYPVCI